MKSFKELKSKESCARRGGSRGEMNSKSSITRDCYRGGMSGGVLRFVGSVLVLSFAFTSVVTTGAHGAATPAQEAAFVSQVKETLGKGPKGWKTRLQIVDQGRRICSELVKTGYSPKSIEYQAEELTPAAFPRSPIKRVPARRVVAAAIQHLCPMPSAPPALVMAEGWVREDSPSFAGPFTESYKYVGVMTYGTKIPIGNVAQVPAQRSRFLQIDCTGEWYRRSSFPMQLIDASGTVLAKDRGIDDRGRITSCSSSEIADLSSYPTATHIFIPVPSPILAGVEVSGPGVGLSLSFTGIGPADYCDPGAGLPMNCRLNAGAVYFPPA